MKTRLIVPTLLLLAFVLQDVLADTGDTLWTNFYGHYFPEIAYSVQETLDEGFIIAGYAVVSGVNNKDFFLVRTDSDGNPIWSKTYGGDFEDVALSVVATDDSCFVAAGWTKSFGAGETDFYLIKVDASGDTLWTQTYGSPYEDIAKCVQQTTDGGYVICGETDYDNGQQDDFDVYVIKTDALGEITWTYHSGGVANDGANSIIQTSEGDYMLTGYTAFGNGFDNIYVEKISNSGSNIWYWGFHPGTDNLGYSIVEASDGNYVVAGRTFQGDDFNQFYLMKINNYGSILWEKTYGDFHTELAYSIDKTPDDGFIIGGAKWISYFPDSTQFYLVKTDSEGNMLWDRTYMYGTLDEGTSVISTSDGNYAFAGYSNWMVSFDLDYCLMKIEGDATTDIKPPELAESVILLQENCPNPFNSFTEISYSIKEPGFVSLNIYDQQGRKVKSLVEESQPADTYSVTLNGSEFESGIYFYNLQVGKEFSETKKMIFMR